MRVRVGVRVGVRVRVRVRVRVNSVFTSFVDAAVVYRPECKYHSHHVHQQTTG